MKSCSMCLSWNIEKESTTNPECEKFTCLDCGHEVHELNINPKS